MKGELIAGLDKQTTRVILASAGLLLGWSFISSIMALGPVTASIITYSLYGFYWFYSIQYNNPLVMRLLIFGTVAGILELVTDHYLVETINSLVYPTKELMIWSSPAYMPFAWSNVLLQLGFIGVLLTRRFGILKASIMLGIAGGMYIPLYEHLANNAGWWWYKKNTLMVLNAPVYVIVCEALISLSLPILIQYAENHSIRKTLVLGVLEGVWILISAFLAFSVAA
ncbi:MAG: hypothetical protein ABJH98_06240 [Reichenbachiella sp.]|uniref:DUF6989 domain-containing protein n=1 Tax=Reichenbachiella sp. TaxID=2184521 RepID=UPI00329A2B31